MRRASVLTHDIKGVINVALSKELSTTAGTRMNRVLTLLFAVAGGAAVGNLYYAQPLLGDIADSLHVSEGSTGLLVTAVQVGYALGIVLLVPLGDRRDRRRLVPSLMVACAAALAICSVAPGVPVLAAAFVAMGVTTVSGQVLVAFAGDLAADADRGRVVGVVVSGLVTGILVARVVSGLIAEVAGWRAVYVVAACVMVVLAVVLYRVTPSLPARTTVPYRQLLRSTASLLKEPVLRVAVAFGSIGFATFTMFWTALTFLLSGPPHDWSTARIGLLGVVGLVGSLAAQGSGRLHDRGWSVPVTGWSWALAIVAWLCGMAGAHDFAWLIVSILALDVATQSRNILNQARVLALSPEARSRVNTVYVCGNFCGGALGSTVATALWAVGGWSAICWTGAGLSALGALVWARTRTLMAAETAQAN
ncbi:MFS transporter [Streptomyces sp. NRRL WC-3725]|uniref:MFS transporter n=1 Tax=Streptomyces sp. NRRL WC-3725 TaxID=1463933 RepID=UPI000AD1B927|nr:MFS transporter [Streptomyces sp. NRRL WC-3725]